MAQDIVGHLSFVLPRNLHIALIYNAMHVAVSHHLHSPLSLSLATPSLELDITGFNRAMNDRIMSG